MQLFGFIAYFTVGIVQLFAIASGIQYGTEFPQWMSFAIALLTTYVPILGSILGVYGAINVWDWTLIQSLVLFFWYVPVYGIFLLYGMVSGR